MQRKFAKIVFSRIFGKTVLVSIQGHLPSLSYWLQVPLLNSKIIMVTMIVVIKIKPQSAIFESLLVKVKCHGKLAVTKPSCSSKLCDHFIHPRHGYCCNTKISRDILLDRNRQ